MGYYKTLGRREMQTSNGHTNGVAVKRPADSSDAPEAKVLRGELAVPTAIDADMDKFLDNVWGLLKDYWNKNSDKETKVFEQMRPEALKKAVNVSLEGEMKVPLDSLFGSIEKVLKYSVRTSHPRFMNMLYGNTDIVGVLGEVIATFCNTNIHTFEVSPVFTLMEHEVMRVLTGLVAYTSAECHDSLQKGANLVGIGMKNLRSVPTNDI